MLYGFLEFFGILMWIDDDVVLVIVFLVDKWVCFCLNERGCMEGFQIDIFLPSHHRLRYVCMCMLIR